MILYKIHDFLHEKLEQNLTYTLSVFCVIIISISLALLDIDRSMWLDESYTIQILESNNFLEELILVDHPPLYFLIVKIASLICFQLWFLRIPSIIFYLASIFIMIKWVGNTSRLAGVLAGLLFASFPLMLRYSVELRGYSLFIFSGILFYYLTSLFSKNSNLKSDLLLILSCLMTLSTHATGAFLILSVALFFVIENNKLFSKLNLKYYFLLFISGILYLPIYFLFVKPAQIAKTREEWWIPSVDFPLIQKTFNKVFAFNNLTLILLTIFLLAFILFTTKRKHISLFVSAISYWMFLIVFSIVSLPVFWYRVAMPILVPFVAFILISMAKCNSKRIRLLFILLVLMVFSRNSYKWLDQGRINWYENWKFISNFTNTRTEANDIVLLHPPNIGYVMKYYLDPGVDIHVVNFESNPDSLFSQISKDYKNSFLVLREDYYYKKKSEMMTGFIEKMNSSYPDSIYECKFGNVKFMNWKHRPERLQQDNQS